MNKKADRSEIITNKKVDRAAQFLPFEALKGLNEALRAREEKYTGVERKELSEEQTEELSKTMSEITNGSKIELNYFSSGHYYDLTGIVRKINFSSKYIIIDQEKIMFEDIYKLTKLNDD